MKHFSILSLVTLMLLVSCGQTNSSKENGISEIEGTEEYSEKIMPHFFDLDRSQFSYTENTYQEIDELLELTLQVKVENQKNLSEELRNLFIKKIELMINERGNLSHDSHSILMEYCHPLIELVELCFSSMGEKELVSRVRDLQVYLLNFEQLFPKK